MLSRSAALLQQSSASGSRSHSGSASHSGRRLLQRIRSSGSNQVGCSSSPLIPCSSIINGSLKRSIHSKRDNSTFTAAIHATPKASAAAATTPSGGGNPSYEFELFGSSRPTRSTRLPTPLPPNVTEQRSSAFRSHLRRLRQPSDSRASFGSPLAFGDLTSSTLQALNENDSFFTPSETVEDLAILRACLATGLTQRAIKVFDRMRDEVSARRNFNHRDTKSRSGIEIASFVTPLDVKIYNAMIGTYFRKAWQEEQIDSTRTWLRKAWQLFEEMEASRGKHQDTWTDPPPDEGTYAVLAKGVVRFQRANRYPAKMQELSDLLGSLRQSGIRIYDVLTSSVFSQEEGEMEFLGGVNLSREGEPDARGVLRALGQTVAEMGDIVLSSELDEVNRTFQTLERKASKETVESSAMDSVAIEKVPELLPVGSFSKGKAKKTDDITATDMENEESEISPNMRILRENLSIVAEAKQSSSDAYERQHWLEFGAMDAARKRFEEGAAKLEQIGLSGSGTLQRKPLQRWMWSWYKKLEQELKRDLEAKVKLAEASVLGAKEHTLQILPFLQLLPPEKLSMITVLEMMRMQTSHGANDGLKTANALVSIGRAVEREHYADIIRKNGDWLLRSKGIQNVLRQGNITNLSNRKEVRRMMAEDPSGVTDSSEWSTNIRAKVGSYLVQHLMDVAKVRRSAVDRDGVSWDEEQPAFYSSYQYIRGKLLGVIRLNDVVVGHLANDSTIETLSPRHLPMLVPPNSWIKYDSGGYLSVRSKALRFKDDFEQGSYLKAASEDGNLEYVLSGLDVLGSTAWRINKDIFDVMLKVWNSGDAIAEMPSLKLDKEEPIRPENYDTDMKARAKFLASIKQFNLEKMSNYSRRCDVSYRLEIARAFIGERFYFPHNMDFRGRAYPIPPHLNHIGHDISRGLLLFDTAKPLGKVGLRWLRIHLANVYGFDKASFSEREQFATDHEKDILDSIADPLGKGQWWLKADDPWQCLATCMELKKAMNHPQGPEMYECRLPVHQDGTCNGLQHYAALGGDMAGAEQVNLRGKDRPSDVYTAVSDLVIDIVAKDAANGHEHAKLLEGMIGRKVVKQTVMTTVYGVTFIGARAQVAKQLLDRGLPAEHVWHCSSYLAKQIMSSIGDLFSGADAIQEWLRESARLIAKTIPPERVAEVTKLMKAGSKMKNASKIAKEQMTSVIWTTPLGLPVVQPYRKVVRKQVATSLQSVYVHDPHLATQVSPQKQATAFPPNFIHSLDATHMFLTALECQSAGLTFASVHDSYWTHACDIETMSDIIRDTFVRLHSCDILGKLKEEFLERYAGHAVPVLVAQTSLQKRASRSKNRPMRLREEGSSIVVNATKQGKLIPQKTIDTGRDVEVASVAIDDESEEVSDPVETAPEEGIESSLMESAEKEVEAIDAKDEDADKAVLQKFVPLKDILPDLPQRGSFDVNEIKRSLYFFS